MLQRCGNANNPIHVHYGGRGIKVCQRWLDSFEAFYADMGTRPTPDHSIERRDVNGDYEPGNCYWATWTVQHNNRTNNVRYDYKGKSWTESELARTAGISTQLLKYRLGKGMSLEEALKPARPQRKKLT